MMRGTLEQRLWSRVQIGAPGECWEWLGAKHGRGYGTIWAHGKVELAHRIAYALAKPSMFNSDLCVLHACDNPSCCRPGHMFQGTNWDNVQDRVRKGRTKARGKAKLTLAQVHAIRADTRMRRLIAADYKVSIHAIDAI